METENILEEISQIKITLENQITNNPIIIISDEYKLVAVNHCLNSYPTINILYTEYGAGIGGAGEYPISSTTYSIEHKIYYEDKNNLTIYVPKKYIGSNPMIQQISKTEYIVTYSDSIVSILFNIIN